MRKSLCNKSDLMTDFAHSSISAHLFLNYVIISVSIPPAFMPQLVLPGELFRRAEDIVKLLKVVAKNCRNKWTTAVSCNGKDVKNSSPREFQIKQGLKFIYKADYCEVKFK